MSARKQRLRGRFVLPLCLALLLSAPSPRGVCAPASGYLPGDADGDGTLSAGDARLTLRAAVGLISPSGEAWTRADADGDGALSAGDARLILRAAVGLETLPADRDLNALPQSGAPVVTAADGLYTNEMLAADLETLHTAFPSRFSYETLGVTADGREIFCAVIGTGHGARQIVVDAGIHGSESLNPAAVMETAEFCLRNYDLPVYEGKTVRELLDDTDIFLIPMLNPDGIAISQSGLKGLRSAGLRDRVREIYHANRAAGNTRQSLSAYLREWKANAAGVDLNRNFPFSRSGLFFRTGVSQPAKEEFAGDRADPEPETAAYMSLFARLSDPVAVISVHSQGGLVYWSCGQSAKGKTAAKQLADVVCRETGYWRCDLDSFVGASADWAMIEKGIPAVTVECGTGKNPLPASALPEITAALKTVFLAVADWAS